MTNLPALGSLKRVHVIGVCGTLMGAFAAYLKRRGIDVSGSDQNVYPPMSDVLEKAGVRLFSGYSADNLSKLSKEPGGKPDLVVIGNVINRANPEARAAIDGGYAYTSLPEAMEKLMLVETRNLVVSGTHGKTTTSSLLAYVLTHCGRDPNYFIGGVSHDLPVSFQVASIEHGRPFVLEGDEYDTAFWDKVPKFNHYLPDDAILTSVEYDHADIYPSFEAVVKAFEGLVDRIRPGGKLIACLDYPAVQTLMTRSRVPVITYGSNPASGARFTPAKVRVEGEHTVFEVLDTGKRVAEISLQLPALDVDGQGVQDIVMARELGISASDTVEALAAFRGVKRRQEVRGEIRGVMVMDDFAHHPTAVRETLKALRARYPKRRLVAVFEPRSATSRRKVFQQDYVEAFLEADSVFISTPYDQSTIKSDDQFSSDQLVGDIVRRGREAVVMATVDEGVSAVARLSKSGDLVAVLSNGGFGGFIPKLLKALGDV